MQKARENRRKPTPAEEKLWDALRGRRLAGLKFRRQHAYGRFVLDYFCVEHQLEIEVDGGIHLNPQQAEYDAARAEFLQKIGIKVLIDESNKSRTFVFCCHSERSERRASLDQLARDASSLTALLSMTDTPTFIWNVHEIQKRRN